MSRKITTAQKESRLSIRALKTEKTILEQAAQTRHMNISQFVLQASLDAAHAILTKETEFHLSPDQWEIFYKRLDAPAKNIAALNHLFNEADPYNG